MYIRFYEYLSLPLSFTFSTSISLSLSLSSLFCLQKQPQKNYPLPFETKKNIQSNPKWIYRRLREIIENSVLWFPVI